MKPISLKDLQQVFSMCNKGQKLFSECESGVITEVTVKFDGDTVNHINKEDGESELGKIHHRRIFRDVKG